VWLYHKFTLSFRDIEELQAARGITVSYETIRNWCQKFGQRYWRLLKKNRGRLGDTWYLNEVFININGVLLCLRRAVDQDGDEIDILVQKRKDKKEVRIFFKKSLRPVRRPIKIVIYKLRSYSVTKKGLITGVEHSTCALRKQPMRFIPSI
jgi:putative transposase